MNSVKSFLEVNFEDGDGGVPFKVDFDGPLYGVKGLGSLPLAAIPTLGLSDLGVNEGVAVGEEPAGVKFLELGH